MSTILTQSHPRTFRFLAWQIKLQSLVLIGTILILENTVSNSLFLELFSPTPPNFESGLIGKSEPIN